MQVIVNKLQSLFNFPNDIKEEISQYLHCDLCRKFAITKQKIGKNFCSDCKSSNKLWSADDVWSIGMDHIKQKKYWKTWRDESKTLEILAKTLYDGKMLPDLGYAFLHCLLPVDFSPEKYNFTYVPNYRYLYTGSNVFEDGARIAHILNKRDAKEFVKELLESHIEAITYHYIDDFVCNLIIIIENKIEKIQEDE